MKLYYDLHIHTGLSPCGDEDMSPGNIINMSILKGLDIIAITDHNSITNCLPCIEAAKNMNITVIPGMEIQSKEDVHLICLFKNYEAAENFDSNIRRLMIRDINNPDFFGRQIIFDKDSNVIGEDNRLLISSIDMSIKEVFQLAESVDGVVIPAHINKKSFSIISSLGFIPNNINFTTLEVSKDCNIHNFIRDNQYLNKYKIIKNSDAHFLKDISERENYIEINDKSIENIIKYFKTKSFIKRSGS